jgi:hypothetical protein
MVTRTSLLDGRSTASQIRYLNNYEYKTMTTNPLFPELALSASGSRLERTVSQKPMRELLELLRQSAPNHRCEFSVSATKQSQAQIAASATTVMGVCNHGMAAIGHLLAHSAPVIEDGTIGADTVEALGWLLTELGDLAAYCMVLAVQEQHTNNTS